MPKGIRALEPRRNPGRARRAFLATYGEAPWECGGCGESVHQLGRGIADGLIHHRDEDPTNDDPSNLVAMHDKCHVRYHRGGKIGNRKGSHITDETRRKITTYLHSRQRVTCVCGKITYEGGPLKRHQRSCSKIDVGS